VIRATPEAFPQFVDKLPTPSSPCIPTLAILYESDGGEVGFDASAPGCAGVVAWNLYQAEGLGKYRRLSSLPIAASFSVADMALNESRTYYATTVGHDGLESAMTQGYSVLHNDIVAPGAPTGLAAEVTGSVITLSWTLPSEPNIAQVKVWASATSGGPYSLAATEGQCSGQSTFSASSGTWYVVVSAVDAAGNESPYSAELTVEVP